MKGRMKRKTKIDGWRTGKEERKYVHTYMDRVCSVRREDWWP